MTYKPKAYSYLRFSTADQAKGGSHRRQLQLAEDYARAKGLELDKQVTFKDLGVSAYTGKNKRVGALRQFLEAVEEGYIEAGSYLLVESLDRVSRELILDAQATFLQIVNAGIILVTLKGNPREYSRETVNANPTDLLISLLELIRAREESDTKSQRIRADWLRKRERAARGEAITSLIPAWLRRKGKGFEMVDDRAEVVRRIYRWTLEGVGQHSIAARLTREGVPTFGSSEVWGRSYIKRILGSPAVVGTFVPRHMVDGKPEPLDPILNYFPPVVDAATWEAVRAIMSKHQRTAPPREVRSLFSGLARCSECGGPMTRTVKGHRRGTTYAAFNCQRAKMGAGCKFRSVRQETLEAALVEGIGRLIADAPPPPDQALSVELQQLETQIDLTTQQIEALVEAISQRPLGSLIDRLTAFKASLADMKARREAVSATLRDTGHPGVTKRLIELEDALTEEVPAVAKANILLRQLLKEVVIHFDPNMGYRRHGGHMEFRWRTGGTSDLHWGATGPAQLPRRAAVWVPRAEVH